MRFFGCSSLLRTLRATACAFGLTTAVALAAIDPTPSPTPSASPAPASSTLPEIGHVRAVTQFCRVIVDNAVSLADDQLADIATTTEALRILAFAPLDRDRFTTRRAAKVLETLADRLMKSRQGEAQFRVASLRAAARPIDGRAPRPDLAHFAGALDGAHSESSRVAQEIARALSVIEADDLTTGGLYMPDYEYAHDPRFQRAAAPVPFPVDPQLERFPPNYAVENGPLHAYARPLAFEIANSLDVMYRSINEARHFFPTAFAGCVDVDTTPPPSPSAETSPLP